MIKTKLFKKLFSIITVALILVSQSPLGSLLGTVGTASAAGITSITVTSPNGGGYLKGTNNITWTSDDPGNGSVDIYYCRTSCSIIIQNTANDGTYSWDTTPRPDGNNYTIRIIVAGYELGLGAAEDTSDSTFTIDNTPPSSNTISINGGATATSGSNATLTLSSTDTNGVSGMQFSCDNSTWTTEETYATTKSFSIIGCGTGDGTKTVYVKYKDSLGNRSTSVSDDIMYDTTAPTITITNPNTSPAKSKTITGSVNDGTLKYYTVVVPVACDGAQSFTTYTTPLTFDVEIANGIKICFQATDALGNITYSLSDDISGIDTTNPTSPTINYGSYTPGNWAPSVTFTITGGTDAGGVAGYQYSYDGEGRTNYTTAVTLSSEGTTTVYARTVDNAGNYSAADGPDTVKIDGSKPTVDVGLDIITNTGLVITGIVSGSIAGVSGYRWFNDDTSLGLGNYVGGAGGVYDVNLSVISFTANAKYTLGLLVTDNAGNTGSDTMEFTRDTTAPIVSGVVATPSSASGMVNVTVYFTETLAGMYVSQPPTVVLVDGSDYTVTAVSDANHTTNGYRDATPTIRDGTINVSSRTNGLLHFKVSGAKDNALNTMVTNNDAGSITVDTAGPTFTVNTGTDTGPVKSDTINVTVSDAISSVVAGSIKYGFSDDTCNGSDTIDISFTSAISFTITGDHTDYLCVKATDSVGNISYQIVGKLNTDNTSPTITTDTLTIPNGGEKWAGSSNHTITWTNGDITDTNLLASPITLAYSIDGSIWTGIAPSEANDGAYNRTHPEINSTGVLVRITAADAAGNTSSDVSNAVFTIDSSHPTTAITDPISGKVIAGSARPITATGTDNYGVSSVVFYYNSTNDNGEGSQGISTDTSAPYTASFDTTVLNNGTRYLYTVATDTAGNTTTSTIIPVTIDNTKPEILNNIINFPNEVATSDTLAGRATHRSLDITQVEYFIDTIGTNGSGLSLDLGAGTTAKDFGGTVDVSALSDGFHTIYVHAMNSEGVRGTGYANKTFKKIYPTTPDTTAPTITPNETPVQNITKTTANIAFQSSENGQAKVHYGKTVSYTNVTEYQAVTANTDKTISLSDLSCGTTYHYKTYAKDALNNEANTSDANFTTLACDSTTGVEITSLYISNLGATSAKINYTTDTAADTGFYRISTTAYTGTWTGLDNNYVNISSLATGKTYYYQVKFIKNGQTTTSNPISFKTATASDGIKVNSIERILNGNNPTPGGDYTNGYHFRFDITVNNMFRDTLKFKLANRSNSVNTMEVASKTEIFVSEEGIDSRITTGTILTAADTYSSGMSISALDADSNLGGKQLMLDMFYKIPAGSQGIFSTSYGMQASTVIRD